MHHRRAPGVDGGDDLLRGDSVQVGAGRGEVRVPQLALDQRQRDPSRNSADVALARLARHPGNAAVHRSLRDSWAHWHTGGQSRLWSKRSSKLMPASSRKRSPRPAPDPSSDTPYGARLRRGRFGQRPVAQFALGPGAGPARLRRTRLHPAQVGVSSYARAAGGAGGRGTRAPGSRRRAGFPIVGGSIGRD